MIRLVYCDQCGSETTKDAFYCSWCGRAISEMSGDGVLNLDIYAERRRIRDKVDDFVEVAPLHCDNRGWPTIVGSDRFCAFCGKAVSEIGWHYIEDVDDPEFLWRHTIWMAYLRVHKSRGSPRRSCKKGE